jgi:hypothetical protein
MHLLRKLTFSRKPHLGCQLSLMGLQPLFMSLILSITYLFMDVMLLWSLFSGKWCSWLKFISSFWLCFGSTQLALLNVECFLLEYMDTGIFGSEPSFDHSLMISSLIGMVDCSWIDILWFFCMASWFITLFNCDMIYVHVTLKPSLPCFPPNIPMEFPSDGLWCNHWIFSIFEGFWFGAIAIDENRAVSDMTLRNQDQNKKVNLGLFVRLIFVFPATPFLLFFQPFFDP